MPDDLIDLNTPQSDDEKPEVADEVTSWWIGRWAHVIALVVFAFLYFPLSDHVWTWLVAATVSYIVFMLCCTCGLSFQDSDDFFGNPEVIGYMAILLLRQTFVFAVICLFAYLWRYLTPILPAWGDRTSQSWPFALAVGCRPRGVFRRRKRIKVDGKKNQEALSRLA